MSLFTCPVCGQPLHRGEKSYRCEAGHCFDLAAQGYVHLLPVSRMNSHDPGDDKSMVNARAAFLAKGYYAPLRTALQELSTTYALHGVRVLDLGCGEGYYTAGVLEALQQAGKAPILAGVDISKAAVKLAARKCSEAELAVASVFHLPVGDASLDLLVNCFSPLCMEEITRTLRTGGHFIYVVPGPRHLWGLKAALYAHPYENQRKETPYPGFVYREIRQVAGEIELDSREDIQNLFRMTPYCWKTSPEDQQKLDGLSGLHTPIEFDLHVYEKQ